MYNMRESWTDERLDDFRSDVNRRFDEVDRRFEAVDRRFDRIDAELRAHRGEMVDLRREMNAGFEAMQTSMNDRFESLQRLMLQSSVVVIAALIALIATQL